MPFPFKNEHQIQGTAYLFTDTHLDIAYRQMLLACKNSQAVI